MQIDFRATRRNGWTVLYVSGELDMATAPQVRQQAIALVADGSDNLIVDLSEVGFCDSTGLGVLVSIVKRVRMSGGELRLVTDDDRLISILEITRLDRVFDVYPNVAGAATDREPGL